MRVMQNSLEAALVMPCPYHGHLMISTGAASVFMRCNMKRWKRIKGYEGLYDISDMGEVRTYRKQVKGRHVVCDTPHIYSPRRGGLTIT